MIYYARSKNENGEMETVAHHLKRAGELCSEFLEDIGYMDWGKMLGNTHDFAKISTAFQKVLARQKSGVNHALSSAAFLIGVYGENSADAKIAASVIASHHGDLKSYATYKGQILASYTGDGKNLDIDGREYALFGTSDYKQALTEWRKSFQLHIKITHAPDFEKEEDSQLSKMLFERFLFSALVDADWSSSSEHFEPNYLERHTGPKLDPQAALERLFALRRRKQQNSTASVTLNSLRDQLFDTCLEMGKSEPGLYTLTAPTGLGKTLSLMAFALQHCLSWDKKRIILILPFLTIIEQNSKDYREVIPDLLEIHSNAVCDDQTRLLSERWDAPCIVTTNVSFFEPFFSAKPGECRHLHQLANGVIVLDEAQSLPAHLLDATLRTVKLLCEDYGCTVVFSTATQPSFHYRPDLAWKPKEIIENSTIFYESTRRVKWDWRVKEATSLIDLADEMYEYHQCCIIVNKKAHARKLLKLLLSSKGEDEVFYLSTDLCPSHRRDLLEKVRYRLENGLSCYLVSTQCIEAGVDIDFPVVYRALAPLDSIIQAAGRCNRNGDSPQGLVVVFIPDEDGNLYPTPEYEKAALNVVTLMSRHEIDCNNLAHIDEYYKLVYEFAEGDNKKLRDAIEAEDYPETEKQYRMIKESGMQVIVPYSGEMELYKVVRDKLDKDGLTAEIINLAKPIMVSCYDERVKQYCEILYHYSYEDGIKVPTGYYFLGIYDYYTEKQGICFENMMDGIF